MKNVSEKRGESRLSSKVAVFIEVETTPHADQPTKICITNTIDVSANGIQLITDFELPKQSIHSLLIEIADLKFNLVGEVMWASPVESNHLIGFHLIDSEHTDIELWKKYICETLDI